jgi:hypothetical protein
MKGRPPFVVVVDVGHVIELYAEFTRSGATYTPFPDPRSHRIRLAGPGRPRGAPAPAPCCGLTRWRWTRRASARVTRQVAVALADWPGRWKPPATASQTWWRLPLPLPVQHVCRRRGPAAAARTADGAAASSACCASTATSPATLLQLHAASAVGRDGPGGFSPALHADLLRFNGKLFKGAAVDDYVLPLDARADRRPAARRRRPTGARWSPPSSAPCWNAH